MKRRYALLLTSIVRSMAVCVMVLRARKRWILRRTALQSNLFMSSFTRSFSSSSSSSSNSSSSSSSSAWAAAVGSVRPSTAGNRTGADHSLTGPDDHPRADGGTVLKALNVLKAGASGVLSIVRSACGGGWFLLARWF